MKELLHKLEESTTAFNDSFKGLSNSVFTHKLSPEKWSIAEVVEHINISDKSAYIALIKSDGLPSPEHLAESARKVGIMTGRENRTYIAPEPAEPKGIFTEVEAASVAFLKTRNRILTFAQTAEMEMLATGFEHPRLGLLVRSQWIEFLTWHTLHHQQQIMRILNTTEA
jgi:DinB superfamily